MLSKDQFAELLVGAEVSKVLNAIKIAENDLQAALNENQEMEMNRTNPTARIGNAIRRSGEVHDDDDDDDE